MHQRERATERERQVTEQETTTASPAGPARGPHRGRGLRQDGQDGFVEEDIRQHRLYQKTIRRTTKLMAHDEQNSAGPGALVRLAETWPLSASKLAGHRDHPEGQVTHTTKRKQPR